MIQNHQNESTLKNNSHRAAITTKMNVEMAKPLFFTKKFSIFVVVVHLTLEQAKKKHSNGKHYALTQMIFCCYFSFFFSSTTTTTNGHEIWSIHKWKKITIFCVGFLSMWLAPSWTNFIWIFFFAFWFKFGMFFLFQNVFFFGFFG